MQLSLRERLERRARFEPFETRALMTAAPIADFHLDYTEQDLGPSIDPLAERYGFTGLTGVRDTYGLTGAGQTVAIIDSGIAYDHYALGGGFGTSYRVVGGWDFTEENDANPYDDGAAGSHGTHVAGIVGSSDATSPGVAPGVDLVGLRVFNDAGSGYFTWVEKALQWVHTNRNTFRNPITTVNLSIGTMWNATTVPSWSTLEDEFAQLKADGIFVAVAAGNSFTSYNTSGLSYPAASSYVVPVASVDDTGTLSYFSQRQERVLAAPGRNIRSTVPDYVGNLNRKTDDFASYSGTSMASPFVAGASVLVRQALQFAGRTNITQDTIYDIMRQTADAIYDSATNQNYLRLNVGRAIQFAMPGDDYGSTAGAAHQLPAGLTATLNGIIGSKSDRDYFSFTATSPGRVEFSAATGGKFQPVWEVVGGGGTVGTDGKLSFDVMAGQTYTVGLSSSNGIGAYSLAMTLTPVAETDLGAISAKLENFTVNGEQWFKFTAQNTALLSLMTGFGGQGGNVELRLYDANYNLLATDPANAPGSGQINVAALAGQTFHVRVVGINQQVALSLANIVSQQGNAVGIAYAPLGANSFTIDAGSQLGLRIDGLGLTYSFSTSAVGSIQFQSAPQRVTVNGTAGNDTAVVSQNSLNLRGSGYQLNVSGANNLRLAGGLGVDEVTVNGSSADETLVKAGSGETRFDSSTFHVALEGCEVIRAYGNGGYDVAELNDSAGNDVFGASSTVAEIISDIRVSVVGFDRVVARASQGNDVAYLYDSAGNDVFGGSPTYAEMFGAGYFNAATGFDRVEARASTGNDVAYLYDSAGNDVFGATPRMAEMFASGQFYISAWNFDRTSAVSRGGVDAAYFYGSEGNDVFGATPTYAEMFGSGYHNTATNFKRVRGFALGGFDVAHLYDSAGDDEFFASSTQGEMYGSGFFNSALGFDKVNAYSRSGNDRAVLVDSDYDDLLEAIGTRASLSGRTQLGSDYLNLAIGFAYVKASANLGTDTIHATATDFLLETLGDWQ